MQAISIRSEQDQYIINIDKKLFDTETIIRMVEWLRLEGLASRMNTGDEILEIDEDIKKDWWERNRDRFEAQ